MIVTFERRVPYLLLSFPFLGFYVLGTLHKICRTVYTFPSTPEIAMVYNSMYLDVED